MFIEQTSHVHSAAGMAVSFHRKVSRCRTFTSLNILCLRFAKRLGLEAVAYHHLPQLGALERAGVNVISVGFPKELVDRFESQNLIGVDPSIGQIMSGTTACWWRELVYVSTPSREELDYLNAASEAVGEGLMLPVFGHNGRNGYVSLGFGNVKPEMDDIDISLLQSCCQFAHLKYCALLQIDLPRKSRLSPREKEVLSWVAQGKSNGVIAEILDIAESTIITHLERSYRKLGVDNRVTAALRALSLGDLRYLP